MSSKKKKKVKNKINKTNKNDIINIFGKPSTISTFNDNTWFYIQTEKENQSFLKLGKTKIKKNYYGQKFTIGRKI